MRITKNIMQLILPLVFVVGMILALPAASSAIPAHAARPAQVDVGISVGIAPPAFPYYEQPLCPGEGFIWTPGYWAWDGTDYYWVPGTWVEAPFVGGLWTPGYWGWGGSAFMWHVGYWGPQVGFYGGINYGYGYGGFGYEGGRWNGGVFAYNTSVSHIDVNVIHNTYVQNVTNVRPGRVAYNGGTGGVQRQPTAGETAAAGERRAGPTADQAQHQEVARSSPAQHFSTNHGTPAVAATAKPGDLSHGQPAATRPAYRPPTGTATADHAATSTEHATTHAANTTEHATTHAATPTEHATTHAATSTAHATTHAANTTEHATTHAATSTAHTTSHAATSTAHTTTHAAAPHESAPHGGGSGGSAPHGGGDAGSGHDKPGH
jgi:hypothetical protein